MKNVWQQQKNLKQLKLLLIKDQFYYGVSCNRAYQNSLTSLPDAEYVYPDNVQAPHSNLPDYSDNTHRIMTHRITVTELFDAFGSEINGKDGLDEIINGTGGYCACNNMSKQNSGIYDTLGVNIELYEVKSVDWIGVSDPAKSKKGYKFLTTDPKEAATKIWVQNTYFFWRLQNTKKIFGIGKLGFAERTKGKESFQNFTTNIYRSQVKSAVELSIGENKKAMRADIKLQHAVIMSLPAGRYIDLRFLRNGLTGTKEKITEKAMLKILNMAAEQNILLGDTTDFEGKNDGQFKPVIELAGGLRTEVTGYLNIIVTADKNISRITGINEQLTGTSANPDGLIGLQKLLINSSINALQYCTDAVNAQMQSIFSNWTSIIKTIIDAGGKPKEAILSLIGSRKANVIEGLADAPLHDIGVFVKIGQREEEKARYDSMLNRLIAQGVINASDQFLLDNMDNPKDKFALLAVREQQAKKAAAAAQQQAYQQQQILAKQQGDNMVAGKTAEAQGKDKNIFTKGEVDAHTATLLAQLGQQSLQTSGVINSKLQRDRNKAQEDKNIASLTTKAELENQKAIVNQPVG